MIHGRRFDADMDEEMRLHVALLTEQNLAAGMSPREARRAALLKFGPATAIQETCRSERPFSWLGDLARDASYGVRTLRRSPGFALLIVLTLALGIGACAAIFSVVNSVLLRPLPYPASDRLVVLQEINLPWFPGDFVRPLPYAEWRRQATSFENIAAVRSRSYNLTGVGESIRVSAARVTANTFSTLGVRPAIGRDFFAEEDVAGKGNVVVLSHGFWVRRFAGRPDVLHQTIALDGQPFTIVGVMPRGFQLDEPLDLFTPAAYVPDSQNRRSLGAHSLVVLGALKPGVTPAQAQSEMTLVARRLAEKSPEYKGWSVRVKPMLESKIGAVRPVLFSLLGAVGFLLLIACTNVANLLLVQATARSKEMAIRAALGANRGRIARQLLTESVLLALTGGLLGVLVAHLGLNALLSMAPDSLPRAQEIVVDAGALGFTFALTLATGIGFGIGPAFAATRTDLSHALNDVGRQEGGGGGGGTRNLRLRHALIVSEVAIALLLLAGAGLLIRSFAHLQNVPRGFRPEGALTFSLSLSQQTYDTDSRMAAFTEQATARIAAIPGVDSVGASQALPFSVDLNVISFVVAGHPDAGDSAYVFECTPGYFKAMGIRLLRGRLFDARDIATGPRIAIINESLARKYFGDDNPIGKRMAKADRPSEGGEIVGVVGDVRDGRVSKFAGSVPMQIYVPLAQNPYDVLTFVVRGAGSGSDIPAGLPAAIGAAIREVDKDQPIARIRTLDALVGESIARQRFAMLVFAIFSIVALVLAAIGIYGVMAHSVAQRTGEIGIRMALGAQASDVLRLVLLQGGRLVACGLAAGLVGALLLTRFLSSLLFGVSTTDPTTFAAMAALMSLVAAVACLVPATRAVKVAPMTALRAE